RTPPERQKTRLSSFPSSLRRGGAKRRGGQFGGTSRSVFDASPCRARASLHPVCAASLSAVRRSHPSSARRGIIRYVPVTDIPMNRAFDGRLHAGRSETQLAHRS